HLFDFRGVGADVASDEGGPGEQIQVVQGSLSLHGERADKAMKSSWLKGVAATLRGALERGPGTRESPYSHPADGLGRRRPVLLVSRILLSRSEGRFVTWMRGCSS